MGKYFGTDGIRGRFGEAPLTLTFAARLGSALGQYLRTQKPDGLINVVIGRDTRESGAALSQAMAYGLGLNGVYIRDAGVVPTPVVARMVLDQHSDLGIVITASHNPATDNGIKLFDAAGCKLCPELELAIEGLVDQVPELEVKDVPEGSLYPLDAIAHYTNYMRSLMDQNCLKGWKIVLDLANGATCEATPAVFRRWGADLHLIGSEPDGTNINLGVGSECPEALGAAVVEQAACLGIAHDGDGDRLVVCDETGAVVDGDILLGLFAVYAMRAGVLRANTLVATIHSNLGLDHAVREAGGEVARVDVGDRNVAARMRELGANIGGESSGHIIFSDFSSTGDGLLAAIKLIELMRHTGKPLSELRKEVVLFPQSTVNLRVSAKLPLEDLVDLNEAIQAVEKVLGDQGRVLVRYSGTEPKLRLLVEGRDRAEVVASIKKIENAARQSLDVIDS